ncbi:hypothetical protein JCM14076_18300 [Methylosoma difficile]
MMALRILILLLLSLGAARADELLVVTGLDTPVKDLSSKQLENIFLRKNLLGKNGLKWIPLNLAPENPLRRAFSEALLKRKPEALETYWNEQYFNGITPPHVVASEEAMLRFVTNTPGAIGYILPCHLDNRVQVILKLATAFELKPLCTSTSE